MAVIFEEMRADKSTLYGDLIHGDLFQYDGEVYMKTLHNCEEVDVSLSSLEVTEGCLPDEKVELVNKDVKISLADKA